MEYQISVLNTKNNSFLYRKHNEMNWSTTLKDKCLDWANNDLVLVEWLTDRKMFYNNKIVIEERTFNGNFYLIENQKKIILEINTHQIAPRILPMCCYLLLCLFSVSSFNFF